MVSPMKRLGKSIARRAIYAGSHTLKAVFGNAVTPDGYLIRVGNNTHASDYIDIWRGRYEAAETQILRNNFKSDHTIIEIGSNIGLVARIAIEEKLDRHGCYIAVEPNPRAHHALETNLLRSRKRDITKKFEIVAAAVAAPADEGKQASFTMRPNMSSGLDTHTHEKLSPGDKTRVRVTSLSEILKHYAPNGASLIMDAEGAEYKTILQDADAFKKIHQMSIEFHDKTVTGLDYTPNDGLVALQKMGFNVGARVGNTYYLSRSPA